MKKKSLLIAAGIISAICLCGGNLLAQDDAGGPGGPPPGEPGGPPPDEVGNGGPGGPGGPGDMRDNNGPNRTFDPAQFEQRMLDRTRETLSVTNDDEWNVIQPLIQKVMEARRDLGAGGMGPGPGGFGGPGNRSGGQGRPGPQASSEQQALQKVVDSGAPLSQIKDALAKYRAARKDKQAKLEAAQNNLKAVLSTRQEAQAVLVGLLP